MIFKAKTACGDEDDLLSPTAARVQISTFLSGCLQCGGYRATGIPTATG